MASQYGSGSFDGIWVVPSMVGDFFDQLMAVEPVGK